MSTSTATPATTLPMDAPKAKPRSRSTRKVGKTASKPAAKATPEVKLVKPPVAKLRKASKPEGFDTGLQIARDKDGSPKLPKGHGHIQFVSEALADNGQPEVTVWISQRRWAKAGKPEILGSAFAPPSA